MSWLAITGSAAYDVAACPPRAAFPTCREPAGERADRGNELHAFARNVTVDPDNRESHLAQVSEQWRHTAAGMNLDAALDGLSVEGCEIAFALDVKERTCRLIGENIDRKYQEHLAASGQPPLSKYEIPFTVDVVGTSDALGCPVELDYKSGQSIGDVEEHGQRRISAAGLMLYHGADTAISRVAYIWDDGTIKHDGHEFSILDAWETCDFMVSAIDAVVEARAVVDSGRTPDVYPDRDKQCKYCSAFNACPYWNNLIRSAAGKGIDDTITPGEEGVVYDRLKDLEKVLSSTLDKLREKALKEPLPVDDKYEFRAQDKKGRSYFDASAARGLITTLLQRLGEDDESIGAELAKLTKMGASSPEVRKRKRVDLPVIKKSA